MDARNALDGDIEKIRRIEMELLAKGEEVLDHARDVADAILARVHASLLLRERGATVSAGQLSQSTAHPADKENA